VKKNPKSACSS